MTRLSTTLASMLMSTAIAYAVPAHAQDFTVTEAVPGACPALGCGTGTFTLDNNISPDGLFYVDELIVSGLGATAGTTRPGWSAEAFFGAVDPLSLGCGSTDGYSILSGFCYKLTDASTGTPVGPGMSTSSFTFDASFTDPALPGTFYVLFTDGAGAAFSCSGTVGSGCDTPAVVPEPAPMGLFVVSLIGLATTLHRRQAKL
jgi:hypothetical protein